MPARLRSPRVYAAVDAYVNSLDRDGCTPLFLACQGNHAETVQLLLRYGADPRIPNRAGITPLAVARNNRNETIMRILRRAGARE